VPASAMIATLTPNRNFLEKFFMAVPLEMRFCSLGGDSIMVSWGRQGGVSSLYKA
jgi:hypothetical protein